MNYQAPWWFGKPLNLQLVSEVRVVFVETISFKLVVGPTATAAKSLQSCPTLSDPIDGSPPGSTIPGILQVRLLEWVAISFSNACMHAKSLQSCLTL